ncbi:MAG: DUF503 domain-containing protein [Deltaproteobacteria bacterium]|nr:DUF503 domain-containing protein [Deltaproteobacteria bacterium]
MVVGTLIVSLRLHGVRSLKEKRRPRRMLCDRVRSKFKVAAAEVADHETWDLLTLAFATVGPDRAPVEHVLRAIADFIEDTGEGELIDEGMRFERY